MSVGKRIYLKRHMPDPALVEEFRKIPASNTADVMMAYLYLQKKIAGIILRVQEDQHSHL